MTLPPGMEASDGPKPLSPTLYFARLAQRLIAALTTRDRGGHACMKWTCGCAPPATRGRWR